MLKELDALVIFYLLRRRGFLLKTTSLLGHNGVHHYLTDLGTITARLIVLTKKITFKINWDKFQSNRMTLAMIL